MPKEFKSLSEKIRELDLKVMNDEISLLVFLNLRTDLDKEFIKIIKEDFRKIKTLPKVWKDCICGNIDKRAGPKLITK